MNKHFAIIQVGYTFGIYGVSGKFYQAIITDEDGLTAIPFNGLYGADERIARELEAKGYKQTYVRNDYGKMTRKDMLSIFLSEKEAIEKIQEL